MKLSRNKMKIVVGVFLTTVIINAEEQIDRLDQIVITGTKTEHRLRDVPVETVVITKDEIEESNAQNVAELLKTVPGVNGSMHDDVFGTYTYKMRVRGLSVNDGFVLVLVDGQRVVGAGQSGGMGEYGIGLNQIPISQIERIEVVKGAGSALYGSDAAAGVINIITKKSSQKFAAGGGVRYGWYKVLDRDNKGTIEKADGDSTFRNTTQTNLYLSQRPHERIGYRLDYSHESGQDINQKIIPSYRNGLNIKIDALLGDNFTLNVAGGLSRYIKEEVENEASAINRDEKSYNASTSLLWLPNDAHTLKLTGYGYRWDFTHGFAGNKHGLKQGNIDQYQATLQHTFFINDNNTLTSGFEFNRQGIAYEIDNYDGSGVKTTHINTYEDIDAVSLYVQDELSLFERKITVIPGIRLDVHSQFGTQVNPKLAIMGKISKGTKIRGSVGRSFKSPTIRQLYYDTPYLHKDVYMRSNPDLKPENGMGYSAGVEQYLLSDKISLRATWFLNDMKEMVIKSMTDDTIDGVPVQTYVNAENVLIQGVELSTRFSAGGFDLTAGYTFSHSENKDLKKELPFQPKHSASIVPAYNIKSVGMRIQADVQILSDQFSDDANTEKKIIGAHTLVGVKLSQKIAKKGSLFFEANNLFNSNKGEPTRWRSGRSFTTGFRFDI